MYTRDVSKCYVSALCVFRSENRNQQRGLCRIGCKTSKHKSSRARLDVKGQEHETMPNTCEKTSDWKSGDGTVNASPSSTKFKWEHGLMNESNES
jgi:hypothetical protein